MASGRKWPWVVAPAGRNNFAELITIRYPCCVYLEYESHEDDPMPGMQKSFAFVRGVLAGMNSGASRTL